jgi:hypothetical protein
MLDWVIVHAPASPPDCGFTSRKGLHRRPARRHRHRRRKTLLALTGTVTATALAVSGLALTSLSLAGALADQGHGPAAGGPLTNPGVAALPHDGSAMPSRHPAARHPSALHPSAAPSGSAAWAGALHTSCTAVAHIGDSTSVGMVSALYLPERSERLAAQYRRVGVRRMLVDASGGRSIVETLPGQVNGYNVALRWDREGYHGCWVLALGTNDTANVYVGSSVSLMARIGEMMSAARGQPVLWVNAWTLLSSGPWSQANMRLWNQTLLRACAKYPNMRIFDWAAVARPRWFLPDGIHYTPDGYATRAREIANALALAFPRNGQSHSCVVV